MIHECDGCPWVRTPAVRYGYADCTHPRWKEIKILPRAYNVMSVCRCPLGRQRRCAKCGKMMKFTKNKPKYHGGEWGCKCGGMKDD